MPEIYYHDLDPDNDIGAPVVLMERMPGRHLNKIWDELSLDGKKSALSQIALVIAQLSSLKFDQNRIPRRPRSWAHHQPLL